jgi:hypothetical protein
MYQRTLVVYRNEKIIKEYIFDNSTELLQMVSFWEQLGETDDTLDWMWF